MEGLYTLLKTLNIPVAYDHFNSDKQINPPFIIYREIADDTFKGDNKTYYSPRSFEIELITEKKNPSLQKSLEDLLNTNSIPYDKDNEVWDADEKIYHNFYEI